MNVQFELATGDFVFFLSEEEVRDLNSGKTPSLEKRVNTDTFRIKVDHNGGMGYITVGVAKASNAETDFSRIYTAVLYQQACSTLREDKRCGGTYETGSRRSTIDVIIDENASKYMPRGRSRAR